MLNTDEMLRVERLSKSFMMHKLNRKITGAQNISFTVRQGEFLGITGPSGSGKSTILKSIYRTYLPQQGVIKYHSKALGSIDLATASERDIIYLRKYEIGYVSQFLNVLPRTSAIQIVEQSMLDIGIDKDMSRRKSAEMLDYFGLDESLWDSYPVTFSGGEKLRLNVATAMIKKPRLLLLDEPTASLDAASKEKVRILIEQLKTGGTTMIGIFHDIEFMRGLCDTNFVMSKTT